MPFAAFGRSSGRTWRWQGLRCAWGVPTCDEDSRRDARVHTPTKTWMKTHARALSLKRATGVLVTSALTLAALAVPAPALARVDRSDAVAGGKSVV